MLSGISSEWIHDTVDQVGRAVVSGLSVGAPAAIISTGLTRTSDVSGISVSAQVPVCERTTVRASCRSWSRS